MKGRKGVGEEGKKNKIGNKRLRNKSEEIQKKTKRMEEQRGSEEKRERQVKVK